MCATDPPSPPTSSSDSPARSPRSVKRRSVIGAALAGTGVAVATAIAAAGPAEATTLGTPLIPVLPVKNSQPTGTVLTLLGTSGGPQAEYVRCGTSSVLTVEGYNYLVDAGRSSVTQYINSGLVFNKLQAMFMTHLHADHLADFYNYFLLEGGQPNAEGDRLPYAPGSASTLTPQSPLYVFGPGSAGALPVVDPAPPVIAPANPVPGIKDLVNRLNEGYAYSYFDLKKWLIACRGVGENDLRGPAVLLILDSRFLGRAACSSSSLARNRCPAPGPASGHAACPDRVVASAWSCSGR